MTLAVILTLTADALFTAAAWWGVARSYRIYRRNLALKARMTVLMARDMERQERMSGVPWCRDCGLPYALVREQPAPEYVHPYCRAIIITG